MASKRQRKRKVTQATAPQPVDKRIRQARITADVPGLRRGDTMVGLSVAKFGDLGEVWFPEPLVSYTLLVDTRLDERRATRALDRASRSKYRRPDGQTHLHDSNAIVEAQRLGTRVCILAVAALEAFAAEVLPKDAEYVPTTGKRKDETLDREGIQWLPFRDRFGDALPAVLGCTSIKRDQDLWTTFKRVLALRNAAIHPTFERIHSTGGTLDPGRLSARVLAREFAGAAAMVEAVMERYSPGYVTTIDRRIG